MKSLPCNQCGVSLKPYFLKDGTCNGCRNPQSIVASKPAYYRKVWFECPVNGKTAGLVLDDTRLETMTVPEVSRLFPYSEAPKMKRIRVSPKFPTFDEAFHYSKD